MDALAIVEQVHVGILTRWHFRLQHESGVSVHLGSPRILKLEAMADRDALLRRAGDWRGRVADGYADTDGAESELMRVMLRALWRTRDQAWAPGG